MKNLIIFGNSEIASLAYYYFSQDSDYKVVAFTIDDEYIKQDSFEGLPLIPFSKISDKFPPSSNNMHVALSYQKLNKLREQKYSQAKDKGYILASYICSKSFFWEDITIGDNCFILENQTIQPTVKIGNNVMLWSGNHIGHGSYIGNHTYISSHVVISGHCKIGERCFFGVNATLKDFLNIGSDSFISMDASVTKDVDDGSVVLGAKSEIFDSDSKIARMIRKKYFGI